MDRNISKYFLYNPSLFIRGEWFYGELKKLKTSQYIDPEILIEIQREKISKIFKIAIENTEYYKKYKTISIDNFNCLPLLDKETVRKNSCLLRNKNYFYNRKKTSGGSTGAPVSVYKNPSAMACELAAAWRGYEWAGIRVGDRQARFWGVPQKCYLDKGRALLIDFVCNRYRISAFGYNESVFISKMKTISKFDPVYFYGYVSIIKEFAKIYKNNNKWPINPKTIITTSEVLEKPDRIFIEKTFNCKVFDEYGCGEVGTIAHQCEFGQLHINSENVLLEVVDEFGKNIGYDKLGELVVTDLNNISMPLIRYKLGDMGVISSQKCGCGRSLPVLNKVFGRKYESIIDNKGKKYHGEFFLYIVEDLKKTGIALDGIQIIQDKNKNIMVKYVCDDKYKDYEIVKFFEKRISRELDSSIVRKYLKVESIDREPSGKLSVVKREK